MPRDLLTPDQVLAVLTGAPERISAVTAQLAPDQLRTAPREEWSATDLLAHLRACADMWGDSIATILAEDQPTILAINPRTWIEETDYRELDFEVSLRAYTAQRAHLLALLGTLSPDGWARSATITGAGAPLPRSVLNFGDRMARHERGHLKQFEQIARALQPKPSRRKP
jgi:hypothetical protein